MFRVFLCFVLALLPLCLGSNTTSLCFNPPLEEGGLCGPDNNNAGCPPGNCCSEFGFCGSTRAHCNVRSLCDDRQNVTNQDSCFNPPLQSGLCGPNHGDAGCAPGECCSQDGKYWYSFLFIVDSELNSMIRNLWKFHGSLQY